MTIKKKKICQKILLKKESKIHDSYLDEKECLFYLNNSVYQYHIKQKKLLIIPLSHSVNSPVLYTDDSIYYNSGNRCFIKFSLGKKKVSWKRTLPHSLAFKPFFIKDYIVLVLRDNNIYFFSKNGNIMWVKDLDKTILYPPITSKDCITTVIYPKKNPVINFFFPNTKTKRIYQTKNRLINPLYFNNQLLFISIDELNTPSGIVAYSNKYSVAITITPAKVKIINKSVIFTLKSINLIEPAYAVTIYQKRLLPLFKTSLQSYQKPAFTFTPKKPGKYIIELKVNSKNQEEIKVKKEFFIFDLSSLLKNYFYNLQIHSITDLLEIKNDPKSTKENH